MVFCFWRAGVKKCLLLATVELSAFFRKLLWKSHLLSPIMRVNGFPAHSELEGKARDAGRKWPLYSEADCTTADLGEGAEERKKEFTHSRLRGGIFRSQVLHS